MDMREQPPAGQISAKDGSPLPKNPYLDLRVREAIDLGIDRKALAEIAMEGLGKPVNQLVTPSIFGYTKALPERKYDVAAAKKLMAEAGYPNGFKLDVQLHPGPPARRPRRSAPRSRRCWRRIGIDVCRPTRSPAAVFFPARTRGDFSMSMSGWGTLTGEAHYTLSSLAHSNDKEREVRRVQLCSATRIPTMDKLIQDAAVEMDEGKRRGFLEKANELVLKDRQRLPIVAVGSAWAMQKDKVTIKRARRRGHARDEHHSRRQLKRRRLVAIREAPVPLQVRPFRSSRSEGHGTTRIARSPSTSGCGHALRIAIGIHWRLRHARPRLLSEAEWAEARAHLADALKAGWAVLVRRPLTRSMRSRPPSS